MPNWDHPEKVNVNCLIRIDTAKPGCLRESLQSIKTRKTRYSSGREWDTLIIPIQKGDTVSRHRYTYALVYLLHHDYPKRWFSLHRRWQLCRGRGRRRTRTTAELQEQHAIDDFERPTGIFDDRYFPIIRDCLSPEQINEIGNTRKMTDNLHKLLDWLDIALKPTMKPNEYSVFNIYPDHSATEKLSPNGHRCPSRYPYHHKFPNRFLLVMHATIACLLDYC